MLNLTVRFAGVAEDGPERLDLVLNGAQRMAVTTAYSYLRSNQDETVRHRNTRLRMAARQLGEVLANQVLVELRTMGHAV